MWTTLRKRYTKLNKVEVNNIKEDTYFQKNNLLNIAKDGKIQLDKDKEAVYSYFLEYVNPRTVFFHTLKEKLNYLTNNNYIKKEILDLYSEAFVKKIFKRIYDKKFRFNSFMGAYKFYSQYALKTKDGEWILERYEDRLAFNALAMAEGNEELALDLADELINRRYQPATPTFLNIGKTNGGEYVSCFTGETLVRTEDALKQIQDIVEGDMVLTHDGTFKKVIGLSKKHSDTDLVTLSVTGQPKDLTSTLEHPVLAYKKDKKKLQPVIKGDGDTHNLKWIKAEDVEVGDLIAIGFRKFDKKEGKTIKVMDFLSEEMLQKVDLNEDGMIYLKTVDRKNNKKKDNNVSEKVKMVKNEIVVNEEFGRYLGYYISEGYLHDNSGIRLTFATKEKKYLEDVKELSKKVFGVKTVENVNKDNSTNVNSWSIILSDFFMNIIGTGYGSKKFTEKFLKNTTESFMYGVLVGTCRGDGCMGTSSMILEMTNPTMVKQLQEFGWNLNLISYYSNVVTQSGNVSGRLSFPANNYDNVEFIKSIGKNLHRMNKNCVYTNKNSTFIDGYALYKVTNKSIKNNSSFVYNLEVEENHTYVVDTFIVHNCFLLSIEDSMNSIGRAINSSLQLSKRGGGVALDLSNIRGKGDAIRDVTGLSDGVIPVMKLLEDSFSYANQSGKSCSF